MKSTLIALGALVLAAGAAFPAGDSPSIQGVYLEARNCDIWTGPCFSNSEINLRGQYAVTGWSVTRGAWDGVALDGLKIAAAIRAEGTLHTEHEGKVIAALFVDERASEKQGAALVAMARALAPKHLENVVRVERRTISFSRKGVEAELAAGDDVKLKMTALCACDAICCHEEQAYPTIGKASDVACAKTVENAYQGKDLGARWSDPSKRSAMVGSFAR